jgi:ribosomal protein S27AE
MTMSKNNLKNVVMGKALCPLCDEPLEFNFVSDRWECQACNYVGLFEGDE